MEGKDIFIALGQALFSMLGACVKWLNEKDKRRRRIFTFVSEIVSAAFSGLLVFLIYSWLRINIYVAFAIAGIVGNQGAKGIDLIGKIIIANSGIEGLDKMNGKDMPSNKSEE